MIVQKIISAFELVNVNHFILSIQRVLNNFITQFLKYIQKNGVFFTTQNLYVS